MQVSTCTHRLPCCDSVSIEGPEAQDQADLSALRGSTAEDSSPPLHMLSAVALAALGLQRFRVARRVTINVMRNRVREREHGAGGVQTSV